jgi:two-component sensor histidine kinase/NADH:ubiquinone oxidoreductase subunit K
MRGLSVQEWTIRIGEYSLLRRRPLLAFLVSASLVALAVAIRLVAGDQLLGVPFLTIFSAVALSAFVGGWMAGVFATALGGLAAAYFLVPPIGSFAIGTASDAMAFVGYAVTCAVIVLIIHIAIRVAEANVTLAAQRQVLLMELQHRIKNHLQLLGAMIATHARATTNDKIRARLEEAGRRLQVIAATYDNFYEPGALIDMADHLQKVCAFVEGGVASSKTRISVDAVRTIWPVERVIPLSLIANELLTNGVKHARTGQELEIEISLQRAGDLIRFSVLTKNVKLPVDFDAANSGLGLRIASMLGQQLGGTLTTPRLPDALFVLEFPEQP